jgi:hypothetical protein
VLGLLSVFGEFYRDARVFEVAAQLGIALVDLSAPDPTRATGRGE